MRMPLPPEPEPPAAAPAEAFRPVDPNGARRAALRALGSMGLLAAAGCGGGTELAGVGSGGTGQALASASFTSGPITGFGSVIVNGIRYDDTAASVSDDTGGTRALGELRIGMVVEIEGSTDETAGTGVARSIRLISDLLGPAAAIERDAGRFSVLGTRVQVSRETVWDEPVGLGALLAGQAVEVWGFRDGATGVLRATRVDASPAVAGAKLRGPVGAIDRAAGSLRIGDQAIDLRGLAELPPGLAVGATVQVLSDRAPAGPTWQPGRLTIVAAALPAAVSLVRVDGRLSGLGPGPRFELAGLVVDAARASLPNGTVAALRDGLRVRVTGAAQGGLITARLVEIRDDDGPGPGPEEAEVKGTVLRIGASGDLTVRDTAGRLVSVSAALARFDDGASLADLRPGTRVEVRGRLGAVLLATRIRIDR